MHPIESPALLERRRSARTAPASASATASAATLRVVRLLAACTVSPATATELQREDAAERGATSGAEASFRTPDGWRLRVSGTRFDTACMGGARITLSRLDGRPFSASAFNPARLLARCGATELLVGYTRGDQVDVVRTFSVDDHGEASALSQAVQISRLWFVEPTLAAAQTPSATRFPSDHAAEDAAMALVMAALAGLAAARRAG